MAYKWAYLKKREEGGLVWKQTTPIVGMDGSTIVPRYPTHDVIAGGHGTAGRVVFFIA